MIQRQVSLCVAVFKTKVLLFEPSLAFMRHFVTLEAGAAFPQSLHCQAQH